MSLLKENKKSMSYTKQVSAENNPQNVAFTVGAGLVNRLGQELVTKDVTAVTELVKNAYDADANQVDLVFENIESKGGTLTIYDDGHGMTLAQLKSGFMHIASTNKIHQPISPKYKRPKAGRKGIGRFATQRLGTKLTIITQTAQENHALQLTIDWTKYDIDKNISDIQNPIQVVRKRPKQGTTLIIENLREKWTEAQIKRVFRYITDLLQPSILSQKGFRTKIASQDNSFDVTCTIGTDTKVSIIADTDKNIFEKSIAVIEGYVTEQGEGFCSIESKHFDIDEFAIPVENTVKESNFEVLKEVHFKAYYFIPNRPQYYLNTSKMDLTSIQKTYANRGGIKFYKNGFRVLPYGERGNDWLALDAKNKGRSGKGANIPYANRNFLGFVEIIDSEEKLFKETASREGIIENQAFEELRDFLVKTIYITTNRIAAAIAEFKDAEKRKERSTRSAKDVKDILKNIEEDVKDVSSSLENDPDLASLNKKQKDKISQTLRSFQQKTTTQIKQAYKEYEYKIEELGMMRVLASLGLIIGELAHEIRQNTPVFNAQLTVLEKYIAADKGQKELDKLEDIFKGFASYTSFFDKAVSRNVNRSLESLNLSTEIPDFIKIVTNNAKEATITIDHLFTDYNLHTIPMHPSEWRSIFFNLYSNAKKAILKKRQNIPTEGRIKIVAGSKKDKEKNRLYIQFLDNGIGIPQEYGNKIFNAFVTTSTPVGFHSTEQQDLVGTGLGLKIVRDIVENYQGKIFIGEPIDGYTTNIQIEIPQNQ